MKRKQPDPEWEAFRQKPAITDIYPKSWGLQMGPQPNICPLAPLAQPDRPRRLAISNDYGCYYARTHGAIPFATVDELDDWLRHAEAFPPTDLDTQEYKDYVATWPFEKFAAYVRKPEELFDTPLTPSTTPPKYVYTPLSRRPLPITNHGVRRAKPGSYKNHTWNSTLVPRAIQDEATEDFHQGVKAANFLMSRYGSIDPVADELRKQDKEAGPKPNGVSDTSNSRKFGDKGDFYERTRELQTIIQKVSEYLRKVEMEDRESTVEAEVSRRVAIAKNEMRKEVEKKLQTECFREARETAIADSKIELRGSIEAELRDELNTKDLKARVEKELRTELLPTVLETKEKMRVIEMQAYDHTVTRMRTELKESVEADLKAEIREEMEPLIRVELRDELYQLVEDDLRFELEGDLRDELRSKLEPIVLKAVRAEVEQPVKQQLRDDLKQMVKDNLERELEPVIRLEIEENLEKDGTWRRCLEDRVTKELKPVVYSRHYQELTKDLEDRFNERLDSGFYNGYILARGLAPQVAADLTATKTERVRQQLEDELFPIVHAELKERMEKSLQKEVREELATKIQKEVCQGDLGNEKRVSGEYDGFDSEAELEEPPKVAIKTRAGDLPTPRAGARLGVPPVDLDKADPAQRSREELNRKRSRALDEVEAKDEDTLVDFRFNQKHEDFQKQWEQQYQEHKYASEMDSDCTLYEESEAGSEEIEEVTEDEWKAHTMRALAPSPTFSPINSPTISAEEKEEDGILETDMEFGPDETKVMKDGRRIARSPSFSIFEEDEGNTLNEDLEHRSEDTEDSNTEEWLAGKTEASPRSQAETRKRGRSVEEDEDDEAQLRQRQRRDSLHKQWEYKDGLPSERTEDIRAWMGSIKDIASEHDDQGDRIEGHLSDSDGEHKGLEEQAIETFLDREHNDQGDRNEGHLSDFDGEHKGPEEQAIETFLDREHNDQGDRNEGHFSDFDGEHTDLEEQAIETFLNRENGHYYQDDLNNDLSGHQAIYSDFENQGMKKPRVRNEIEPSEHAVDYEAQDSDFDDEAAITMGISNTGDEKGKV
ncbi:MAG: hypothetical protein M1812_007281 [Candelaria pacifica]|nr:MAG: hypothetical protein M1812_007281 [Candelaria pacifica]